MSHSENRLKGAYARTRSGRILYQGRDLPLPKGFYWVAEKWQPFPIEQPTETQLELFDVSA